MLMKVLAYCWSLIALASMLLYAFSGVGLWSPIYEGDGFRVVFLYLFHALWPLAVLYTKD